MFYNIFSIKIEHKGKNKLCTDVRLNSTVSNDKISDDMSYSILVGYSTETSVEPVSMHAVFRVDSLFLSAHTQTTKIMHHWSWGYFLGWAQKGRAGWVDHGWCYLNIWTNQSNSFFLFFLENHNMVFLLTLYLWTSNILIDNGTFNKIEY